MLKLNFTDGSFEDFESLENTSTEFSPEEGEELSSTWILLARVWALFIAFIGIPGNLITASTIVHQVIVNHRRQRLHSISDSCFHQLKIIKEDNLSESSEASSVCSFDQNKDIVPVRKTTSCSRKPLNLKLPECHSKNKIEYRKASPGKNSLTSFNSRESSPGIQLTTKYTTTVIQSSNVTAKDSLQSNFDFHSQSPASGSDELFYDTNSGRRHSDPSLNYKTSPSQTKHNALKCSVSNNNNIVNDYVDRTPPISYECRQWDRSPSTPSQSSKRQDCLLARKSLSIRSQSVSLNRNDCANYFNKHSYIRIGGDTILILHIIFCDLLYCSINLPHTYYVYGFESVNGSTPTLCKVAAFVRYVNAFAEWMTLGLLAIQRCVDLAKPPNARFFRMKSTIISIAGIWILSVLLQLGNLINENFGYNPVTKKCDCVVGHMTSLLYFYTLDSLLPCGLMMFGCFSIIIQIVRNKRRLQRFGMSEEMVAVREKEMWHSACLVLTLLLLFLFCVIPICIFNVLYIFDVTDNAGLGVMVYMIYWIQYGINFIVYVISKKRFREAYRGLFKDVYYKIKTSSCCCSRKNHDEGDFN